MKEVKLKRQEFSSLSSLIGTVWYVWQTPDMETIVGATGAAIKQLDVKLREIDQKQKENEIVFHLTDSELKLLEKVIDFALKEGEEDFHILLGIERIDMVQMKEKILHGKLPIPKPGIKAVAGTDGQILKCPVCGLVWKDRFGYPIVSCTRCTTEMYNPLVKDGET